MAREFIAAPCGLWFSRSDCTTTWPSSWCITSRAGQAPPTWGADGAQVTELYPPRATAVAARYLALGDRPDLAARVLAEYNLTKKNVLAVTGHTRLLEKHRVLSWAVELRNPYVDALSHLQLRALRALRAKGTSTQERAHAERLFLLTVNGVAAGLQNTG